MRIELTRYTHACVGVTADETRVIIDPGEFGTLPDLAAFDAILITHDHFDHVDHAAVRAVAGQVPVYGPASVQCDYPVEVHGPGEEFIVGAMVIRTVGGWQDITSRFDPPIPNLGYLLADAVLHTGDQLPLIDAPVDTLLLPMETPWAKNTDREDYLAHLRPRRIIGTHDVTLNDLGLDFAAHTLRALAKPVGAEALPLRAGESVVLRP